MIGSIGILDVLVPIFVIWLIHTIPFKLHRRVAYLGLVCAIATHFSYKYFIFPSTNGLDPVYNDEIYFLNYNFASCNLIEILRNLFSLNASQAAPYACAVQALSQWSKNDDFILRVLNYSFIILTVRILLNNCNQETKSPYPFYISSFLLLISPSIFFFSTKVLRDCFIMYLVTSSFFLFRRNSHLKFLVVMICLFVLRRHLAVSLAIGYFALNMRLTPWLGVGLSVFSAVVLSIFMIPPFVEFNAVIQDFSLSWPFSISGLHFLIADSKLFSVSFERVILQRLIVPDTFVPLLIVNVYTLLPVKKSDLFLSIMTLTLATSVWYHYFYFQNGFTAARQTIMPFLPLVLLSATDVFLRKKANVKGL